MKRNLVASLLVLLSSSRSTVSVAEAAVAVSEIAPRGTGSGTCDGEDWVELINNDDENAAAVVDLTGYVLHDDKGSTDPDAMVFAEGTALKAGEYLVLCGNANFTFGIGADDTVTLLDPTGATVDSVSLDGGGPDSYAATTYALVDGEFAYTSVTTPGKSNVFSPPVVKPSLQELEDGGSDFFRVFTDGVSYAADGQDYTDVVDISITLSEENLSIIQDHPNWNEWVTFDSLSVSRVTSPDAPFSPDDIVASSGVGRIRAKGQTTVITPTCWGLKNIPFSVKFDDVPFLGMGNFYLRNHFTDYSGMREYAAHRMLRAVGLPHLRSRPAQLYLNGRYIGFYTIIEAPTQDYVMQRSFGAFDKEKTGLFKMKSLSNPDFYRAFDPSMIDVSAPLPDPPVYEPGRHREDIPVLGSEEACVDAMATVITPTVLNIMRAYAEYNESYPVTMIETDQVGRDVGPKSLEDPMRSFLDKYYDPENDDLNDFVDTDQWLQNIAFMTILVHMDSPIGKINNWYLATTDEGNNDWKIVQWDHNNMLQKNGFCGDASCNPKVIYFPISGNIPCGPQSNHLMSRILNSEENKEKYLAYVKKYTDIFYDTEIVEELNRYGESIAGFAFKDDLADLYATVDEYETYELGEDTFGLQVTKNPFLPNLRARLGEVRKQIDAIENGSLPRNGEYEPGSVCVDWRNPGVDMARSTLADDCAIPECVSQQFCHSNMCINGEFIDDMCNPPIAPSSCESCFPYSRCGSGGVSSTFVGGTDICGPELADCAYYGDCFHHNTGTCAFNGEILAPDVDCPRVCVPCFPMSRCGAGDMKPPEEDAGEEPEQTGIEPTAEEDMMGEPDQKVDEPAMAEDNSGGTVRSYLMVLVALGALMIEMLV